MGTMTMTGAGVAQRMAFGAISAALAAGLLATAGRASGGDPDPSVVRTDQGELRGEITASARIFHDVPYASPAQEWHGVRDATEARTPCADACGALTVTTPRGVSVGADLPVDVRLGGSSTAPDAPPDDPPDDPPNVVVVTVPAGELAAQQAALHWLHRNAVPFGGNPDTITLHGPSAHLCAHLTSPDSAYLFAGTRPATGCATAARGR
ncbi:carboxylesterase family protein [Streptomyces sp. GSL17-111]|uniref:carboxylesterase family protein n=1 Tax=Streptomyces sp. GSL17-111 TaxID=3121596 RepID=UPI0030F443C4